MNCFAVACTVAFGVVLVVPLGAGADAGGAVKAQSAQWSGFRRGIGIGGWLTNYKRFNVLPQDKRLVLTEGDYAHFDSYITEQDVERIKLWGFDHIRLGFDQIVLEEAPGRYRDRTFRKIDDFISWCRRHDVHVVLNLHKAIGNYCDIPEKVQLLDSEELQARFIALWVEMERRYHDFPDLAFEILNEVRDVPPEKWNALADRTLKAIRKMNPTRWVVIGSSCWNSASKLRDLRVWDDDRVVYTYHMYDPYMFTHQRGVLQASPLFSNAEVAYPGREETFRFLAPAAEWVAAHPGKILWNGEFGTIRHMVPTARVSYMRDVVRFCQEHGMPYCVWNYLSTPNDGNRFSLVDDDTRDFLSDELLCACLGVKDRESEGVLKFVDFNIWGPYFGNPVCERDLKIAKYLIREAPDVAGFQECVADFWNSRLFRQLAAAGYGFVRDGKDPQRELNPLIYRRDRLEVLESGTEVYAAEDNPEGSKGFGWAVFRDRANGRSFVACSTHLWWKYGEGEVLARNEAMRGRNAGELVAKVEALAKRHGGVPVVIGGDMNAMRSRASRALRVFDDAGFADAQYSVKGSSPWSSHHGDPRRDEFGNLRAFFRQGSDNPSNSLDHVVYRGVTPMSLLVDRSQDVLECSDHSPIVFVFKH